MQALIHDDKRGRTHLRQGASKAANGWASSLGGGENVRMLPCFDKLRIHFEGAWTSISVMKVAAALICARFVNRWR